MSRFSGLGIRAETPARMVVRHPVTGRPLVNAATGEEAFILLLSGDSQAAKQARHKIQQERIDNRVRKITLADAEEENTRVMAALVRGWSLATLEGEPLDVECSPSTAYELFSSPDTAFVAEQAVEFVGHRGNFLAASSGGSSTPRAPSGGSASPPATAAAAAATS